MAQPAVSMKDASRSLVTFDTHPSRYRHWKLSFDGRVATLAMDVDENAGIRPGYSLKLNSYDLGVDIELHDALQRIRFEHPEVGSVVLTSARDRIFCSGANIFMLGLSSYAWKLNFCKFTNETRNGIEDSSRYSGIKFIAACNGATAGGGYELALACDEILLIDDRSSAVSLPEVPLLGVLPGTGGLTRLTDKRRVRRDHADIFCTLTEGVRGTRAKEWRLVDDLAKPQQFAARVQERALALASGGARPANERGIELMPLARTIDATGYHYTHVDVVVNRVGRTATLTISGPQAPEPTELAGIKARGVSWWPLAMARELDDAILLLRSNELEIGTWILKTRGAQEYVLAADATLARLREDWFVRETIGQLRRTLARLEVSSRTLFAVVDPQSCFAGTLFELALAADRTYMLHAPDVADAPQIALSAMNFGQYPTVAGTDRLTARFYADARSVEAAAATVGRRLAADEALQLGLVTATPDALDWDEELRLAVEERASLSPDALTGLEASLRFGGPETMNTRIFGRLSAWQNWIFIRPNAVGEAGALKVFGTGSKAQFNWERV
jgi:benzoyl-CoA-dihydrodiol lyase